MSIDLDNQEQLSDALTQVSAGLGFNADENEDLEKKPLEGESTSAGEGQEQDPATPSVEEQSSAGPEGETSSPAPSPAPAPGLATPPSSWSPEHHEAFRSAPPALQAYIAQREEEMSRGMAQVKPIVDFGLAIDRELQPFHAAMRHHNIDPVQHIGTLLHTHARLAMGTPEQRLDVITRLAKDYGVPLQDLVSGQSSAPAPSPEAIALQQRLEGLESQLQQRQQAELRREQEALAKNIQSFATDPANKYFNDVADEMARMIRTGYASDLKDAYVKACNLSPTVRAKELEASRAAETKRVEDARRAKAQHAQTAKAAVAANVKSSGKAGGGTTTGGKMDDTIAEAFAAIQARAS